ncbi:hypothetical protein AHiyo1_27370 [Arthrobacter sp. Hiyo1]|nr:hypothetical protein AHiyo1_27370 [Arthrobacter sp. Hiyo1]
MAGKAAVLDQHGVHSAEPPCVLGNLVQERQHQLLARMRDVEAVVAKPGSSGQQIADGGAGQGELQQVDGPVQVAQPLDVGLPLMHGRRQ